jgi:hypothetical protein
MRPQYEGFIIATPSSLTALRKTTYYVYSIIKKPSNAVH